MYWYKVNLPKNSGEKTTEFIAENEDNLEFLRVYTDGSLMKKDRETT